MDSEIVSLIIQLRLGMGYGERVLSEVLRRDYDVIVSHHGVGNVLKRAGLITKRPVRRRAQRRLSDYPYVPGEVGQLDVKHWKRVAYQYDIIDCATRIKYKRLYTSANPANTIDFLEHAIRFFKPAFISKQYKQTMAWSLPTMHYHNYETIQYIALQGGLLNTGLTITSSLHIPRNTTVVLNEVMV